VVAAVEEAEPDLNQPIDKNYQDLDQFLFVESPLSDSKTVSLTKTKVTPKGSGKTLKKLNSTPTSARKKKENVVSENIGLVSSVKKAVKRKTIDRDDSSFELEQRQPQLPPIAPKATPASGQRMKKNVSAENLQQTERPPIPLPPKATPVRKLTKQTSAENVAAFQEQEQQQTTLLEPKATPGSGQRMKRNVSAENLQQMDRPPIPLPPKATPVRKMTKQSSVEVLVSTSRDGN
jgi:hypothetical protein